MIIWTWLGCAGLAPLAAAVAAPAPYALYAFLGVVAFCIAIHYKVPLALHRIPLLLKLRFVFYVLLLITHIYNRPTVLSVAALAICDAAISLFFIALPKTSYAFHKIIRSIRWMAVAVIGAGFVLGPAMAGRLDLDNPIEDLLSRGRVRLFSAHYGHSILIDLAIILLTLAAANLPAERLWRRAMWAAAGTVFVYLAKSSIGYVGFAAVALVFAIEHLPARASIRNALFGLIVIAAAIIVPTKGDDILESLRNFQTGGEATTTYKSGDLTAGRAQLNGELSDIAARNPLVGYGTDDFLLQNGTFQNGRRVAGSESGLRIAAKYGWPYYGFVVLIILSPLVVLRTKWRGLRILGVSLALYCADVFAFNDLFEVMNGYNVLLLEPLVLIVAMVGWNTSREKGVAAATAKSARRVPLVQLGRQLPQSVLISRRRQIG